MVGNFFAGNHYVDLKDRVASLVVTHPSRSFILAALLALLLAPGAALAWHLQTAGSGAATTNAFPKQSSTSTFDSKQFEAATPVEPTGAGSASQESVQFNANVHTSGDGQASVQVNGQSVPVPENGSTHTTVNTNGTTQVDVDVTSGTQNTQSSASSTYINLYTSSESAVSSESTTE